MWTTLLVPLFMKEKPTVVTEITWTLTKVRIGRKLTNENFTFQSNDFWHNFLLIVGKWCHFLTSNLSVDCSWFLPDFLAPLSYLDGPKVGMHFKLDSFFYTSICYNYTTVQLKNGSQAKNVYNSMFSYKPKQGTWINIAFVEQELSSKTHPFLSI